MSAIVGPEWRAVGPAMELGEGARVIGDRIIQVDLLAGRLHELEPISGRMRVLNALDVPLGAVAPVADRPDWWIAAAGTGVAFLGPSSESDWIARPEDGAAAPMRMNDGACDPAGRFWFGSMAYDPSSASGALYRVDPDLSITRVLDGITVPNGPVFDADGTVMYVADSAAGLIHRITLDAAGELTGTAEFARVDGSPDGMCVDVENHLWSAIWGAGAVHRYAPSGALVEVIDVPALQPTSIAIGGGHIAITSATHGLTEPGEHDGRTLIAGCTVDGLPTASFQPTL